MQLDEDERLILQHLLDKLSSQQSYLLNLRNQASISAAITGLVATFFGALLSSDKSAIFGDFLFGLSVWAILAFTFFCMSIAFSAFVIIHTNEFTFSFNAPRMLSNLKNQPSRGEFVKKYVDDGEWFFEDNEKLILRARLNLTFSLIFGFVQIFPWIGILVGAGRT